MKYALMIAIIVGMLLGLLNGYVSRNMVPAYRLKEHMLLHLLLGVVAAIFVTIAIYVVFD